MEVNTLNQIDECNNPDGSKTLYFDRIIFYTNLNQKEKKDNMIRKLLIHIILDWLPI